jgi:lipoprotein-anchoring transpeptidase ErfK/SrfK
MIMMMRRRFIPSSVMLATCISLAVCLARLPGEQAVAAMKPASSIIIQQEKAKVFPSVLDKVSKEPVRIVVNLTKQRVYLLVGEKLAVDSPISSGRRNGWTPKGEFAVLEKDPDHHSSLYGEFINGNGQVIRSGVSSKIDAAPSGTRFRGASMKYFMRLTPQGVGMHAGILPGYPASHGCIRLPLDVAEILYKSIPLNTPVSVGD